jgi:hypothetical protein
VKYGSNSRLPEPGETDLAWMADQPNRSKPRTVRALMAELRKRRMVERQTLGDLTVEEALLRAYAAGRATGRKE